MANSFESSTSLEAFTSIAVQLVSEETPPTTFKVGCLDLSSSFDSTEETVDTGTA